MRFSIQCLISVCITIIACSAPDKYSKETEQFNNYLKQQFDTGLAVDSTQYVLVPSNACIGCMKGTIDLAIAEAAKKNVIFIISQKALLKEQSNLKQSSCAMVDKENKLDKLSYHKGNIGLVKTYKGKIYHITDVSAQDMIPFLSSLQKN